MNTETKNRNKKTRGRFFSGVLRFIHEKPLGVAGAIITLALLFTGIFADVLAPHGENDTNLIARLSPPSAEYPLGADNMGRDILSRVIYGARITVIVGLSAALLSTAISAILGLLTGYIGGTFDLLSQRIVDAWMCLPIMIVLMVIISMIGPGVVSLIIVMGVGYGFIGARVVRGSVISTKQNMYIRAAQVTGCSTWRILFRHILPNITAPII